MTDIVRDGPCVTFPNVHDSSIVQLNIERGNFLEITFLKSGIEKITYRVDGLLEFGVTEFVDGAGVLEIFLAPVSEINVMYIDKNSHPWKLVNQTNVSREYLEKSEILFINDNPDAIYFWVECNSSGYIAAAGLKVSAYIHDVNPT